MSEHCPLCRRELIDGPSINEHHLIPRMKGGNRGPKVTLHKVCHRFIHAAFSEKELARTYNSIEKLLEHEKVQAFVGWVSKKPPEFMDSSKMATARRR